MRTFGLIFLSTALLACSDGDKDTGGSTDVEPTDQTDGPPDGDPTDEPVDTDDPEDTEDPVDTDDPEDTEDPEETGTPVMPPMPTSFLVNSYGELTLGANNTAQGTETITWTDASTGDVVCELEYDVYDIGNANASTPGSTISSNCSVCDFQVQVMIQDRTELTPAGWCTALASNAPLYANYTQEYTVAYGLQLNPPGGSDPAFWYTYGGSFTLWLLPVVTFDSSTNLLTYSAQLN